MTTTKTDLATLSVLGGKSHPSKKLEVFPNHHPERRYTVTLSTDEFTCLCPATGQPDFAEITIHYIPDRWILESKSLKLYLWSFRDEGVFHEHVVNTICDDLVRALDPHQMEVSGTFGVRGGIGITVVAAHAKTGRPGRKKPARRPATKTRRPGGA
jgi:7-cyano-7-deazaguanine reductase